LQRREEEGRLKPAESERLERIVRLTALAEQVWESPDEAREFLTSPHPMLEGQAPLDLAATDLGARRVEALLWKLEYSLPV
jgi:putative toxin-antitoxin system antitoxin component (TIGR02293 family)